jgi:hypothetical protein
MGGAGDLLGPSLALGRRSVNVHRVSELWGLMYELGNRVGESWRLRYELEKQAEEPEVRRCAYKATGEPGPYLACGQPAEYCETQPASTGTYELRLYWLCRQHAELRDAEEEWGDSISDLLEWERALEEARKAETKEEIVTLLEVKCDELRRLCHEFVAYVDSIKYTGKGKHPLE